MDYTAEQLKVLSNEMIIDELMHTYGQEIMQLMLQYVHHFSTAEDLTQEVFVKCYKALPTFQFNASIKTWLWRIAINHAKDYLKSWYAKHVDVQTDDLFVQASAQDVEQQVIQKAADDELAQAVFSLPIKYREVIYLCYYEELAMKDIADVLQLNENTVKTRLRKAKQLLKKRLEDS